MEYFNLKSETSLLSKKTQTYGRRIAAELATRNQTTTKERVVAPTRAIRRTELFLKEPDYGCGACLPIQEDLSAVSCVFLFFVRFNCL